MEALGDLAILGVELHRHVGVGHDRLAADRGVLDVDRHVFFLDVHRLPLPSPGRGLLQPPVIAQQQLEVAVVPLGGMSGPCPLNTTGHGIASDAPRLVIVPAQTLLFQVGPLRRGAEVGGVAVAVSLADGVTTGGQGDGLLIVHGHAGKGHAHVMGGLERIGLAVDAFRVDVDQTHHHRRQRVLQITLAGVAGALAAAGRQPFLLRTPINVLFRMPDVLAAEGEAIGLEAHGLIGHGAGEDDQVGPAQLVAILLLNRPQQAARLVQVGVIRPAIEGREALVTRTGATAAVGDTVGARSMPGHADHQAAVVTPVRRPPVLTVGHQVHQVLLDRLDVELFDLFTIVVAVIQWIGFGIMLMQDVEVERIRPPCHDRGIGSRIAAMHHGAFSGSRRSGSHLYLQS